MKVRQGFVSNSSSSSFTIATKTKMSQDELQRAVFKTLGVSKHSPLYGLAKEIASVLSLAEPMTVEEMADDWGYDTVDDFLADSNIGKMIGRGFKHFYCGSADDQGRTAECALCDMELNYEDDTIMIEKEAGY